MSWMEVTVKVDDAIVLTLGRELREFGYRKEAPPVDRLTEAFIGGKRDMKSVVKTISRNGNSLAVNVTRELAELDLSEGDQVAVTLRRLG